MHILTILLMNYIKKIKEYKMKTSSIIALIIASTFGLIQPASAKSTSVLPGVCSQSSAGSAFFLKQGSQFQLGFLVNGDIRTMGIWHTTIIDNVTNIVLDFLPDIETQGTSIHTNATLPKGNHTLAYRSENLNTGEICTAQVVTKV